MAKKEFKDLTKYDIVQEMNNRCGKLTRDLDDLRKHPEDPDYNIKYTKFNSAWHALNDVIMWALIADKD